MKCKESGISLSLRGIGNFLRGLARFDLARNSRNTPCINEFLLGWPRGRWGRGLEWKVYFRTWKSSRIRWRCRTRAVLGTVLCSSYTWGVLRAFILLNLFFLSPAKASEASSAADRVLTALRKLGAHLPKSEVPSDAGIHYVRLGKDPWELGVVRVIRVRAPFERFASVVENVPGYVGLFTDLLTARSTPLPAPGSFTLYTETRIPVPFVSNDQTTVRYHVEKSGGRRLVSASLVESNHLAVLEGAGLLAPLGADECVYWQVNFLKVGFGAARALPARTFWKENALGGLQADLALRLRAENAELPDGQILAKSRKLAREQDARAKESLEKPLRLEELLARLRP
jgi:hypothetical protein